MVKMIVREAFFDLRPDGLSPVRTWVLVDGSRTYCAVVVQDPQSPHWGTYIFVRRALNDWCLKELIFGSNGVVIQVTPLSSWTSTKLEALWSQVDKRKKRSDDMEFLMFLMMLELMDRSIDEELAVIEAASGEERDRTIEAVEEDYVSPLVDGEDEEILEKLKALLDKYKLTLEFTKEIEGRATELVEAMKSAFSAESYGYWRAIEIIIEIAGDSYLKQFDSESVVLAIAEQLVNRPLRMALVLREIFVRLNEISELSRYLAEHESRWKAIEMELRSEAQRLEMERMQLERPHIRSGQITF